MSHFAVLVIGENPEKQLAPYHEYECTGIEDEYVVDEDVTDKFNEHLDSKTDVVKLADGTIKSRYANEFYTKESDDELDRNLVRKQFELPEGAELIQLTERELLVHEGRTEEQEAESYGGYTKKDGRYYDRTNPNAKWDWYSIGGRWTGWLKLKPGATGEVGRPGLMTEPAKPGTADIMMKGDIDFEIMRSDAGDRAAKKWDKARSITPETWESWESARERIQPIDAARDFYHNQAAIKALKASRDEDFSWDIDDKLAGSREAFIELARNSACTPYAIVKDSKWFARGEMGWWGCSSDNITGEEWNQRVAEMLDALPDETLITVVDCHI